jgi:hypothetical protein
MVLPPESVRLELGSLLFAVRDLWLPGGDQWPY